MTTTIQEAAAALGRKGGQSRSEKKQAASRRNGALARRVFQRSKSPQESVAQSVAENPKQTSQPALFICAAQPKATE